MPTISLRLTDEEHAALKAWAHDSRRSIQKEAVYRLFAPEVIEKALRPEPPPVVADSQPRDDDHFKPDFKK